MKPNGLLEAIAELSQERGLEQDAVIEAIEDAIVGAAYRKYKRYRNIEAVYNEQLDRFDLMHYKVVVDEINDPENEILITEAHELDPLAECGDEVEYEIDGKEFSGVIAQTARQLVFQKITEVERETVLEKYQEKMKDIIHGTISRFERGNGIVLVNNTVEGVLERREQIPFEKLQPGDHTKGLLLDVRSEGRGPQLFLSRTHPDFLMKLFEVEVPEVYDGIIEIIAAAREPGRRAKVAVYSNDPDVDPVGACVGVRGSRIQSIVSELCGERIDVVEWSNALDQFIANAIAPAEIVEMELDEENSVADIKIMSDQLSLAIGKQGQNVRLASKLTGMTINIVAWENPEKREFDEKEAETEKDRKTEETVPEGEESEKKEREGGEPKEAETEKDRKTKETVPEGEETEKKEQEDSGPKEAETEQDRKTKETVPEGKETEKKERENGEPKEAETEKDRKTEGTVQEGAETEKKEQEGGEPKETKTAEQEKNGQEADIKDRTGSSTEPQPKKQTE